MPPSSEPIGQKLSNPTTMLLIKRRGSLKALSNENYRGRKQAKTIGKD
jgi:hypothetical protein